MKESTNSEKIAHWQLVGLVTLCIRFVQGWIFWAGGSRRFIYSPAKLDPSSHTWLANKLQSAMPGALLGTGHVISYLLNHFWLLYISLVLFSLIELLSGLGLILGLFTRLNALLTAIISVILMLSFGWQGGTCLDEWTTAVSSFAMALVLMLSGSFIYSLDHWLLQKYPDLKFRKSFIILASGPLPLQRVKQFALAFLVIAILFTTMTYNYFRGAIFSRYHAGPVSPTSFQLSVTNGQINSNGEISFDLYVAGGTSSVPDYIVRAELQAEDGKLLEVWDGQQLSKISSTAIVNQYNYNTITTNPFGIVAPLGAKAHITLPSAKTIYRSSPVGSYTLYLYTIDGRKWAHPVRS